jgi:tRNA A-37 threonylcarbamoyl transferase component Bud32
MIIKKMNGHSGCEVCLHEEDGEKYIRKISASSQYNSRLIKQMGKQQSFKHDVLQTPTVYRSGYIDNLFYFDMEFIRGVPMHNYVSLNSMNNILPIFDKVCDYLHNIDTAKGDITAKIEDKLISLEPILTSAMAKYCDYCRDYDWSAAPISENHGDLTFENILIYRNKLYFIDFLDSFAQTKHIDYSKMMQDIVLDWSWRHNMNKPLVKTIHLHNKMLERMSYEDIEASRRLLVLNLLRIVPYSNEITLKYLQNRLQYLSKIFGI